MLKITGLSTGYPSGGLVLKNLDLSVPKATIVAVLGRNGMGKTTLMKSICGLLSAHSGKIELENQAIENLPAHKRARFGIGYVPQGREVFADFTVEENLIAGRIAKPGLSATIPDYLYDLFPILKERAKQKAGSFSGGQQQQLAIARSLAGEPRLLLLDEPAEGIQPSIVHEIALKLREFVDKTGISILMAEQNLEMVSACADSVCYIDHGTIAESGIAAGNILTDRARHEKYLSI